MTVSRPQPRDAGVPAAMVCAGAISAQFIAAKADRYAFYLAHLDVTSLPTMVVVTSALSIALAIAGSRALKDASPARFVPAGFALSAVFFLLASALGTLAPRPTAVAFYLQISGVGP